MSLHDLADSLKLHKLTQIFQDEIATIPAHKFGIVGKPSWFITSPGWKPVDLAIISPSGDILDAKTFEHSDSVDTCTYLRESIATDETFVFLEKTTTWFFENTTAMDHKKILEEITAMMMIESVNFSELPVC